MTMRTLPLTSSQTIGPFFSPCLLRTGMPGNVLVQPDTAGERIRIDGRVLDGDGVPVTDALIEIWQANAHGRYHHPADHGPAPLDRSFTGFGRAGTEEDGRFWFETIKPGRVPLETWNTTGPQPERSGDLRHRSGGPGFQAPHIVVTVFARGLLNHAVTRLYFADDPATDDDPILRLVPADRRATLIAHPTGGNGPPVYHFDIHLQGESETAFFNV